MAMQAEPHAAEEQPSISIDDLNIFNKLGGRTT